MQKDAEDKTLIHFAALYGHMDFLQQHLALLREEWVNTPDKQGAMPLYLATRHRHWACVKILLLAKADVRAPTPDGVPLISHWVSDISDPAILEDLLTTQTAAVQQACLSAEGHGLNLLHHAATGGQSRIVHFLIEKGVQADTPNPEGYTPLFKAISNGHTETAMTLLQHGAKLDGLNINGDSPIHYAMGNGRLELARALTWQLFIRLGFAQRPESATLLQALTTLYAVHHRQTADAFFERAQREHEASERQSQLAALLSAARDEAEETKQNREAQEHVGMQPIEPLSNKVLNRRFQRYQLQTAREQLYALLKKLEPTDALIPLVLWALSEAYLQEGDRKDAYEQAMSYAASSVMHYQKLVQANFEQSEPQVAVLYQTLLGSQQSRIITIYRQTILGLMDNPGDLKLADYRTELFQHRAKLKDAFQIDPNLVAGQMIYDLARDNTRFFIELTKRLWLQSWTLSRKVLPYAYALLGFGSMSKTEMCPYSDLEFALLLEKNTPDTQQVFQPIVRLMHLLVIALGETPTTIPAQVQFSVTATGYHFDEGGNTPLQDGFIDTPASLAAIQRDENPGLTIMRNVLRATTFIAGHEYLYETYQQQLKQVLSEKIAIPGRSFFSSSPKRREIQALEILEGALPEFSPSSLADIRHQKGFDQLNIKTDLYRLPTQVIESLSLYYGVAGKTTFEKLQGLLREKIIGHQAALQLTHLLETALQFRFITHLHYGTEQETIAYQKDEEQVLLPYEAPVYVLTEEERAALLSAYQILLPLETALRTFVSSKGNTNPFKQPLLYSQAELAKKPALKYHLEARSYERLFSPEKALGSYYQALQLDPDNTEIHLHYVSYVHSLRETRQRNEAAYEATAVSYIRQLATQLLTLHSQQAITLSGFEVYYEAMPLVWRSAFRASFHTDTPIEHRLRERLDRIDGLPKKELEKNHKESKAALGAKAKRVLANFPAAAPPAEEKEIKPAISKHSPKIAQTAEFAHITTLLKNPSTHSVEEQADLLAHACSLLLPLIQAEREQIEDYNREIEKNFDQVTRFLLIPTKAGIREPALFLKFYRQLPCDIRPTFRHVLLKQQETATQSAQRTLKQQQADRDFFTGLLKTLNEEPDEAGQRESWQAHKQGWQHTLQSLVEDGRGGKNSVCLVSPLLDKQGQQRTSQPLQAKVRDALLDESLEFKANKINGSEHRVARLQLKQADGSSKELYCKAYPEMPGMTYLIERLHHRLIGHGTCLSELVKIERPGKPSIPVLISEGIPGPTLHDVLKEDPQRLQELDHRSYSDLIFLAILTNPEDGLPTNYIVVPKESGKKPLTLVSIDHDHALFPPYLLEPVKPNVSSEAKSLGGDGEEAEEEKQSLRPKLQVKTILFCLEAIHKPVDPVSREALLRLKPDKVLSGVLREAQVQNDYYNQLFDPQMVKAFHENRVTQTSFFNREAKNTAENCTIPIPLKEGDAVKLYQKLYHLQQFLTEYPQATLLQCLLHIEPRVGMAYARALDDYRDPLERLFHLGEYPVNLQGQMVTSTRALKSLRLQTQQIGAEQYADLKDLTPAQGLAELDLMTYQQDTVDSIRAEVMQGELRRFLALKAPEHKAAVISGTDSQKKGIDWSQLDAAKQSAVLDALQGVAFTQLNLSGCTILTKQQLTQLLIQSPDCTVLDLSGHPQLDELWLLEISRNARHLKELTIRQAPRLQHIRNTALFRHLTNLDIAGNPALESVNIRAPQLKLLQAKNCPKLHTLKTASQQLREVDANGNQTLQLNKELAHADSSYTLNRLKLAGCTQLKVENINLLSAYPALLWGPSKEEVQVKIIALLDQYIGREGWQSLSEEQKKQVSARFRLYEYDPDEVLRLALRVAKNEGGDGSVQEISQKTLAVLVPMASASQLQKIIDATLASWAPGGWNVDVTAQHTLAALAPHASASQLQGIIDAALEGVKHLISDTKQAAWETLAALAPHVSTSQLQEIINGALTALEGGSFDVNVQRASQKTLAELALHVPVSQLQGVVDTALVWIKKEESTSVIKYTAQHILATLAPHASASQLQEIIDASLEGVENLFYATKQAVWETLTALVPHVSASQLQEILGAILAGLKDKKEKTREAAQQTLTALAPHLSASQLQGTVEVALVEMKNKDYEVLKAAQQKLVVLVPYVCASQLQEIVDVMLASVKDTNRDLRYAAQQILTTMVPHVSVSQLQRILDAALIGTGDEEYVVIRQVAQKTFAALISYASAVQFQRILDAVLVGLKDRYENVRQTAQKTLAALIPRASTSPSQLQRIFDAVFAGVKDKDGHVRQATQYTLAALAPHASASQLQEIVEVALVGVKNEPWYSLQQTSQYMLAALVPYVSASQLQKMIDAVFTGMKNGFSEVQQAAEETLVALTFHLSATQVQNILRSDNGHVQKAIHSGFIQYAKAVTWDSLPTYCTLINEVTQDDNETVRLIMLSGFPILQQRFGTLEAYLTTLQAERNQISAQEAQTPTWAAVSSIYEQLEAQVIDFYVPEGLEDSVKAYEGATQTTLQTLEDCKAAMEAMVAPELKSHQQQFIEAQSGLFEQYHVREQQRIAAFQHRLTDQSETLTQEALTAAQAQFAKEQAEAKAVFQSEIQIFYEQAGDQLNGETKLDVSELLQKRRVFLDLQLEQREVQNREQQTLLIQWQQTLRDQARELQEPQEESKAETPTALSPQKTLPQTADRFTQLQQALQMLQAKVDAIDQSNRALQEQSLTDQQALQLQRRQLEVLLRERQQAQQVIEAIAAIQAQPALHNFYQCIKVKLGECFVACKMFASGAVAPSLSTGVSVLTQGISLAGQLLPIPYVALISSGIVEGIQYFAKRDSSQRSKQLSTLVGSVIEMDQLAEKIARLLTWRYELQIQQLTHESAVLLGESAVACMMEGLHSKGMRDPKKPLAEQMIQAIYEDHHLVKLPHLFKTKLTTRSGKTDWIASSVLLKCGIALWDKENLTFSFYAQKLLKDPSKKPAHELGSKPEKYGYRLGSLQEVTRLDLRRRANVPAETRTAFTNSISLRFMDAPTKQRAVRLEMPVLLPLPSSPQSAAADLSSPPEEKAQQPHRPPTPRSRADVSVDQEEDGGLSAASGKAKKQVRFSDNIHIILPKPRSSQQDDSPSRSRSPSPTTP